MHKNPRRLVAHIHHDVIHTGVSTSAAPLTNNFWTYATGNLIDYSSAAVINGVVYVGSDDNYLYALNAANGALIWQYKTGNAIDSSPTVANGVVFFGSEDNKVYALNATDGRQNMELRNWRTRSIFSNY